MFINKQKLENWLIILVGIIFTVLLWVAGIAFEHYNIVGGKLFYYVFLPITSLNLIYNVFYFYKIKRSDLTFKDFLKPQILHKYKKKQILVFMVVLFLLTIVFTFPWFYVNGRLFIEDEETELQNVVDDLIKNSNNDTEKIKSILSWFNRGKNVTENFSGIFFRFRDKNVLLHLGDNYFIYDKHPMLCVKGGTDPYYIFISRAGRCGEYSNLFFEMGGLAGLNVSTVNCPGENHAWNEVYLENGSIIIVDASEVEYPNSTGVMTSDFMHQKVARELKINEGNISYVFYNLPNDDIDYDATHRYTDTINLTFNVTDNDRNPLKNVTVKITSYNRLDWNANIGIEKTTNKTGQCTFKLGGGQYKYTFQRDGDWVPLHTGLEYFSEDKENQFYNYVYRPYSIFDNPLHMVMIFLAIFIIVGLLIGFYKLLPRNNEDSKKGT